MRMEITALEPLIEEENEGREEESIEESPERREESSIYFGQRRESEGFIRIPEIISDEEKRDECASLVSFTSSMYSDTIGAQTAATLISRITETEPLIQNQGITGALIPDNPSLEGRDSFEERESPPQNLLNNEEENKVDDASEKSSVDYEQEENDADEREIMNKKELQSDFYDDLGSKPRSWVAWYYPKLFTKYWRYETKEKVSIFHISNPEYLIEAARAEGLYADACIRPQSVVTVDLDKEQNVKKCVKLIINNGDTTVVLARSSMIGFTVLEQANEKIKRVLDQKMAHFYENYSGEGDDSRYEFIYESISSDSTDFPFLLVSSMDLFHDKLTCKSETDDEYSRNHEGEESSKRNSFVSIKSKSTTSSYNHRKKKRNGRPEIDTTQEKLENDVFSFFGNIKRYFICERTLCALPQTIDRMCIGRSCRPSRTMDQMCLGPSCRPSQTKNGMCIGPSWTSE